ncbi:hypothetical protein ACLQ2R_17380 [Streptosporangium sp. DT93]|uniref:hypothetical protein n=1 Tax=Streptosporangium sp. DT93 TaxID=3393428 RepID=UPI003CFA4F72
MRRDPVPLAVASERLGVREATIRVWGTRYKVRKAKVLGVIYWDYVDLAAIDGYIHRGEPVPATPEERDRLREQRRTAYRDAA